MFVLLKGLSRKKLTPCAPLEIISGGEPRYWGHLEPRPPQFFGLRVFIVLGGRNRLMSPNGHSHCIDRFGCFLRYLSRCVSLTMVLFVTLGPS